MSLLDLPLVLVQDIIEELVLSCRIGDPFPELFDLRLVNRLFEREIIKYFVRHRLRLSNSSYDRGDVPKEFIIRLISEHIGFEGCRLSTFAARHYAMAECLEKQFAKCGTKKSREQIFRNIAEAWLHRAQDWTAHYLNDPFVKPDPELAFDEGEIWDDSFAVAVIMQYSEVQEAMLAAGMVRLNDFRGEYGSPLPHIIRLGHREAVQRLIDAGARLELDWKGNATIERALLDAAGAGYIGAIEVVLDDRHERRLHRACLVAEKGAENRHWDIVKLVLDNYSEGLDEHNLKSILCWASRYGNNDLIRRLIDEFDTRPRNLKTPGCKRFPLREAVRGGHPSTVQLLLDNGALGDQVESHAIVLAQHCAIGGSLEVLKIMQQQYFWSPCTEHVFLPLAVEHGHLEFAKHAVEHLRKPRKTQLYHVDAEYRALWPDLLKYFSLLRAVYAGRQDMCRWLVEDVGVDVNDEDGIRYAASAFDVTPLALAIGTGNASMVRFLVEELGASTCAIDNYHPDIVDETHLRLNFIDWKYALSLDHLMKLDIYQITNRTKS